MFVCIVPLAAREFKSETMEVVSRYPTHFVVYNAVGSGPVAVECTLWKWEWLAKNRMCKM